MGVARTRSGGALPQRLAFQPRARGFSLLELMLVLLLLGLVYGLAGPAFTDKPVGVELTAAIRQLSAGARQARDGALTRRQELTLTVDLDQKIFLVSLDTRRHELPKTLSYALFTAQSEVIRDKVASIRFFPDGSSTGGRITVSAGEDRRHLDIDWLTGRAKTL